MVRPWHVLCLDDYGPIPLWHGYPFTRGRLPTKGYNPHRNRKKRELPYLVHSAEPVFLDVVVGVSNHRHTRVGAVQRPGRDPTTVAAVLPVKPEVSHRKLHTRAKHVEESGQQSGFWVQSSMVGWGATQGEQCWSRHRMRKQ